MLYETKVPISFKGSRVEKGVQIELTPEDAERLRSDVQPVGGNVDEVEEPAEEKALDEMSAAELKAKAEELGLASSGTKADLIERITLFVEGGGDDQPEEEEEEEVEE